MKQKHISEAVIRRLPKYYREFQELKKNEIDRISSSALAKRMQLNASQIRQDFNCFGGFGQQGYGYSVDFLLKEIGTILGMEKNFQMVVIGAGNIGTALSAYSGFKNGGYTIEGIFDNNPAVISKSIAGIDVQHVDGLPAFLQTHSIDIGIICTDKQSAQEVCDMLVKGKIRAIWNFAPVDVKVENVFVENIHLIDDLCVLSYRLTNEEQ